MVRPRGMTPAMYFSYLAASKEIGMDPPRITQTIGNAKASAGFHKTDGYLTVKGKREPYCAAIDVSVKAFKNKAAIKKFLHALARHGYVAWFRDWEGNEHIHAVWVNVKMKPQLQRQVRDFLHDRDGLAGHQPETFYTAPKEMDDILRAAFLEANPL